MTTNFDLPEFVPTGYTLLSRLGSGQTSHVYLSLHVDRGEVALKLPRPELQHRPVLRRMFENEVQITINLKHPNVVLAHAGYSTGPEAFLELEYCQGGTLDQLLLEQGRMPLPRCVELISDVARGLQYAHSRQVLHRDVKPANVFLSGSGQAKLGDFGTGIFLTEETQERVGTAFYMAPEIFEGSTSNVRTDVYSLGVLAYEVLTSVRPFVGDSYNSLMLAHTTGLPRDPRQIRDDLSKALSRVVRTSMSRDPDKRFQSVKEFVHDFRAATGYATEVGLTEKQVGRSTRITLVDKDEETEEKGSRGGLFGLFRRNRKS